MQSSDLASASTGDLVKLASEQVRDLVREEIQLAKAEMTDKGKQVGMGAGMIGAAALFGLFGLALLVAAAVLAIDLVLPAWAAALIVAAGLFLIAGTAAGLGFSRLRRGVPAAPEHAIRNVRADLSAVSAAFKEGRHA